MTDERLFKVSQAAQRLQLCPETIRRYIKTGRIRALRAEAQTLGSRGGHWRIPASALEDFLTPERQQTPIPPIGPE